MIGYEKSHTERRAQRGFTWKTNTCLFTFASLRANWWIYEKGPQIDMTCGPRNPTDTQTRKFGHGELPEMLPY